MINRRLLLAGVFFGVGASRVIAQDAAESDPHIERFAAVTALLRQDRPGEAEHLLDQADLRSNRSKFRLGKSTLSTYALTSTLLIATYLRLNDYSNAERVARDRVTWAEQQYGSMAFPVGGFRNLLADIDRQQGKYKEAEPQYLHSLSIYRSLKLDDCLVAKEIYTGLAETYLALKRPQAAEELLSPVIDVCRENFGEKNSQRSDLLNSYAVALENSGKPEEAAKAAAEADRTTMFDHRIVEEERDFLRSRLLASQGRFDASVSLCRKWIEIFEMPDGPGSDRRLMLPLAECEQRLRAAGRDTEGADLGARLSKIRTKYQVALNRE